MKKVVNRAILRSLFVGCLLTLGCHTTLGQSVSVTRLNGAQPIISMQTFLDADYPEKDGENINGPSLIKLPDWLPVAQRVNAKAKYYLYFAHHNGNYLRLAWSERVTGPYHLVGDSPLYGSYRKAVLALEDIPNPLGKVRTGNHLASPIVIVDDANKQFKLYYHAPVRIVRTDKSAGQVTCFATSKTGLQFEKQIAPTYLGMFYFSPFQVHNRWYAYTNHGYMFRAPLGGELAKEPGFDLEKPLWENMGKQFAGVIADYCKKKGIDQPFGVRHLSQVQVGNQLHVFFSSRDDAPERLYHTCIDVTASDCKQWKMGELELVMQAEEKWEGADVPVKKSFNGPSHSRLNEIRDTFVYAEGGKYYLFYCGGGEKGIGIAEITLK